MPSPLEQTNIIWHTALWNWCSLLQIRKSFYTAAARWLFLLLCMYIVAENYYLASDQPG